MPSLVEHAAVAVAAVFGVLAAEGRRVDLFGVRLAAIKWRLSLPDFITRSPNR